jgi:hypothetical protein
MDTVDLRITPVGRLWVQREWRKWLGNPTNYSSMFTTALMWYFGTVHIIVCGEVGSHKSYECWAPKCLTKENINLRFGVSLSHLQPLTEEWRNFLESLVTDGGIWMHYFILRTRHNGMRWKHLSFPRTKRFKICHSAGKSVLYVFRKAERAVSIELSHVMSRDTSQCEQRHASMVAWGYSQEEAGNIWHVVWRFGITMQQDTAADTQFVAVDLLLQSSGTSTLQSWTCFIGLSFIWASEATLGESPIPQFWGSRNDCLWMASNVGGRFLPKRKV